VTLAPTVVIWEKVVPLVERSTLKPVSLVALSAQVRLTWVLDTTAAARPLGASGGFGTTGGVALATLE
jgi:hypothetical protein